MRRASVIGAKVQVRATSPAANIQLACLLTWVISRRKRFNSNCPHHDTQNRAHSQRAWPGPKNHRASWVDLRMEWEPSSTGEIALSGPI